MKDSIKSAASSILRMAGKHFSLLSVLFVFGSIVLYNMENRDWNRPIRLIKDDVHYYYVYVPSVIVYHDYRLGRVYNKLPGYVRNELWLPNHKETGRAYSKMSMGLALIYAPFTVFAHYVLVPVMNWEPDGYSPPYKLGLLMSAMVFLLLGLWHLRKILLQHYSETVTGLTLAIVVLGTNLSWYSTTEATMSHVYSFALIIIFYRLLQGWLITPSIRTTLLTGFVFGLLVLVRPTNLMFLVLFFTTSDFGDRIRFLFRNFARILLMLAMFLVVWAPQFAFWKYVSGDWFFYTYDKESFFWNNPQIISSLFSFRKGWLLYTPLMALSIIGLPILWKQNKTLFIQVVSVCILLIYINSSWWCWWFGGSYGNRAYIDGYGIFALSIGAFLKSAGEWKIRLFKITGLMLIVFLILLNIFQTWQYRMGFMHYCAMTEKSYILNFLKTKNSKDYEGNLVMPDHQAGLYGVYYSPLEITYAERNIKREKLIANQTYFIDYFESLAKNNPKVIKSGIPANEPAADSVITKWATGQYEAMFNRYK